MNGSVDNVRRLWLGPTKCPRLARGHHAGLRKRSRLRALTLVELLVVLTILAILTTVAVVSTETVLRQGRFEATQRTLQAIEEAVLGPGVYRSEDGTMATAGFVADIGRLPLDLSELWSKPYGLDEFDFWPDNVEDPEVFVPYGWRGPYLRLSVGATELFDGWGRPFEWILRFDSEENLLEASVRSLGADGSGAQSNGDPYSRELKVVFFQSDPRQDRFRSTIQVTVWQQAESGGLQVPTEAVDVVLFTRGHNTVLERLPDDEQPTHTFRFYEVPIGPHVLRAYGTTNVSPLLQIQVHPQGTATWQLVLPHVNTTSSTPEEPGDNED